MSLRGGRALKDQMGRLHILGLARFHVWVALIFGDDAAGQKLGYLGLESRAAGDCDKYLIDIFKLPQTAKDCSI